MKVLMINVTCGTGSTGRICTDLAASLEKQGHVVKIAYGRSVSQEYKERGIRIGSEVGIKTHALMARVFDGAGLGSIEATKNFLRWVQEYNPDIIHLHNIHGYYINVPLLFDFLKSYGKPVIWTLHDCWTFTGHTAFCESANCEKWISGCHNCPLIREYPKSFVDCSARNWKWKKRCFNGLEHMTIVTPSYWLGDLVKKSFLSKYPIKVVHNGIDTTVFKPLNNDFRNFFNIGNRCIVLGNANCREDMQEYIDFIRVANKLGDDYRIVLLGLDKKQISNLPSNVIAFGKTESPKELDYLYREANIFLNISYCNECIIASNNVHDYGLTIITYESDREKCIPDNSYITLKKGDIDGVVQAIKKLGNIQNISEEIIPQKNSCISNGFFETKALYGLLNKKVILGVAAVWDYRKGLDTFYSLAKVLKDNMYKVVLVGLSKKQIESKPEPIMAFQRTESINQLIELYSLADVFVNPTVEDNYPTTNLEAACCNTPVITYKTGGSPESVSPCQVVEKGKIDELEKMIMKNHYTVENKEDFDKQHMLSQYIRLYSETIH